jgi:hypothetical protein
MCNNERYNFANISMNREKLVRFVLNLMKSYRVEIYLIIALRVHNWKTNRSSFNQFFS